MRTMKRMTQNRKKSMKQNTRRMKKRGGTQKNQRRNKRNTTKKNRVRNNKKRGGSCFGLGCSKSAVMNKPSTTQKTNNKDNNTPPSASLGANTSSVSKSSPAIAPNLVTYIKKLKMGLPAKAVATIMLKEGITSNTVISFFNSNDVKNLKLDNDISEQEIKEISKSVSRSEGFAGLGLVIQEPKRVTSSKTNKNDLVDEMTQSLIKRGIYVPKNNTTQNNPTKDNPNRPSSSAYLKQLQGPGKKRLMKPTYPAPRPRSKTGSSTSNKHIINPPKNNYLKYPTRPPLPFAAKISGNPNRASLLEDLKQLQGPGKKRLKKYPPRSNTGPNTGAKAGVQKDQSSLAKQAVNGLKNLKSTGRDLSR